jgi:hypothetical protein
MTYASEYDKLMLLMKRASKSQSQKTWNSIGAKQAVLIKKASIILKVAKVKDTGKGWKWLTHRAYSISKRMGV